MKIRDYTYRMLLALFVLSITVTFYIVLKNNNAVYGSSVDWLGQHVAFADYFREYFYSTKELYPEYSLQLGGGVNIAQLVYYGLFRPEILASYFFPTVPMYKWMIISSILSVILSAELLYHWLQKENISMNHSFVCSILFILAGPILFHTHRHPMFINYLPWMILTCIGIKNYSEHKKFWQIPIGVTLMILSSYFFSVSALFMCGIYAIYCLVQETGKINWKNLIYDLFHLLIYVMIGVGMAAFILLPVGLSMMDQHRSSLQSPTLVELFTPDLDLSAMLSSSYSSAAYSAGMGMISIIAVIYGLIKNKRNIRFLSFALLLISVIPIFSYILSGLQYIRAKSLIPMIPLVCLLIGQMFNNIKGKKEYRYILFVIPFLFIPLYFIQNESMRKFQFIDMCLCIISLLVYILLKKKYWIILCSSAIIPLLLIEPINRADQYVSKEQLNNYLNKDKSELVSTILDEDKSLYRFDDYSMALKTTNQVLDTRMFKSSIYSSNSNQNFVQYFYDEMVMPSRTVNRANMHVAYHPLYQSMMGIKYILSDGRVAYGYDTVLEENEYKIIKNENVLPIAYVSSDMMNYKDYDKLGYPYRMEALYRRTIVSEGESNPYETYITPYEPTYSIQSMNGVECTREKDGFHFKVKKEGDIVIELDESISDQFLIIDTNIKDVKNEEKNSVKIKINGIDNKRSKTSDYYANHRDQFRYVLSNNKPFRKLHITLSKGEYTVTYPKVYLMDAKILTERKNSIEEVKFFNNKDSILSGEVDVKNKGYFVASLPYQKGYQIILDDKEISYEKINTAFIGFPIEEGQHKVEIYYKMPGKKVGIIISVLSFGILILLQAKKVLKERR